MHSLLPVAILCLVIQSSNAQTRFVSYINVPNAGQLNTFNHEDNSDNQQKISVLAASYDTARSTYDSSYFLQYPGQAIGSNFSNYEAKTIYSFFYWPREVQQVPRRIFGFDAIAHLDGSDIVGKTTGSIYITDINDFAFPATYDIASGLIPATFMYTSLLWKQVDRGLDDDIMACRVQLESGVVRLAQLVWLEHPREGINRNWRITVLRESACDSYIAETSIRLGIADNYDVIYASGYYTQRLTFFWTTGVLNNWDNPDNIAAAIIESGRQYYDVQTVDINNDGKVDVLVTVLAQNGGSVEVFEIPDDFRNANLYTRRVLASGFTARNGGAAGRTPGIARTFYPTANTQRKPWIMLSGGDDGRAYYLMPLSENAAVWTYEVVTIMDAGASQTVSGITAADVDADGFTEIFVSVHNRNRVEVHSFKP